MRRSFTLMLMVPVCLLTVGLLTTASQARIDGVDQIAIVTTQFFDADGVGQNDFDFFISLNGSGITGLTVTKPGGGTVAMNDDGGEWNSEDAEFTSLSALRSVFPTGNYTFDFIYSGGTDSVTLYYNPAEPGEVVTVNSPADDATGVGLTPTFTWDAANTANGIALGVELENEDTDNYVDSVHPYDIANTSWTPGPALTENTDYAFCLSIYQGTADTSALTDGNDDFVYYGVFGYSSESEFTTVPEPATMALLGLGGLAMLRRKRRTA